MRNKRNPVISAYEALIQDSGEMAAEMAGQEGAG